jgi:NADPH:quinone reductase-like Zn-dependent oxidoreductase
MSRAWWTVPGPDGGVLELRQVALPSPGPAQVLVRVRAAGVNRGELIGRAALRRDNPQARPAPSGNEFAGDIVALGEGVQDWTVGARVMGRGAGGHADYMVVPTRALRRMPEALTFPAAAALPNVVVTAHDALVTNAALTAGESVLITAGSSGVGTVAIQIARLRGATPVIATTRSPGKAAALRALGANDVIDTTQPAWPAAVRALRGQGVDVVMDQVGGGDCFLGCCRSWPCAGGTSVWAGMTGPCPRSTLTSRPATACGFSASRSGRAPLKRRCNAASAVPLIWLVRSTKGRCVLWWIACSPWRNCLQPMPTCCQTASAARLC